MVTAHSHAGESVGAHTPSLAAAYPGWSTSDRPTRTRLDGLDLVFCALPHGESQRHRPRPARRGWGVVVDLAADFRLRDAALYPRWYGEEHGAPELLAEAVFGLPELFRAGLAGATLVAAAGCYPTAAGLALAPAGARPGWSSRAGSSSMPPRGSRAPGGAQGVAALRHGRRGLHRLRPAHPPPHPRDGADPRRRGALHAAPGAHGARHPGHLLRPARRPAGVPSTGGRSWPRSHDAYDDEPFVVVTDDPPSTKATAGRTRAHVTARVDARTGWVRGAVRPRQPGQGRVGPGRPVRQRWPWACPRPPGCRSPGCTRERHRAAGLRGHRRARPGSRPAGAPDVAVVATADGRAVPAAGVFTANLAAAAPVQVSRAHLAATGRPGRRGDPDLGQRQRGHRRAGAGGGGAAVRRRGRRASGRTAEEILVCQTGPHRHPVPDRRTCIPQLVADRHGRAAGTERGGRGGPGHHDHRHRAARRSSWPATGSPWAPWPRAPPCWRPNMATMLALCTTDAAVDAGTAARSLLRGGGGARSTP